MGELDQHLAQPDLPLEGLVGGVQPGVFRQLRAAMIVGLAPLDVAGQQLVIERGDGLGAGIFAPELHHPADLPEHAIGGVLYACASASETPEAIVLIPEVLVFVDDRIEGCAA